ncbi:MAG: hypothetical protein H6648_02740 [Caldilineae bacterium]|nr:hypothetical protein [Chloroflexota bacterium]MCB9176050.1 hypothetical protein [Caldilineae bacterium]
MILGSLGLYVLVIWLGAYLAALAGSSRELRLTGLGLIAYGLALGARLLGQDLAGPSAVLLARLALALGLLAPALWMGATAYLVPPDSRWRAPLLGLWRTLILPLAAFDAGLALGTPWLIDPVDGSPGPAFWLHVAVVAVMALDALVALWLARRGLAGPYGWLLLTAGILFGLSVTSAALPHAVTGSALWSAAVAFDLILLGFAIAARDAFETGERLGPHMLRSALSALGPAAFVGLQLAAFGRFAGASPQLIALALAVLGTLVLVQTAGAPLGRWLGTRMPGDAAIQRERAELGATAERLDRRRSAGDAPDSTASRQREAFDRAVRRALSNLRDLPRLATSPLIDSPLVAGEATSLDRARALHRLLVASIDQLRPPGATGFSSEAPYRHFNALYYPYVVGLRPNAGASTAGAPAMAGRDESDATATDAALALA